MAGSVAEILSFKCSVWSICTGTWPHYVLSQSIFVWYHALYYELPESSSKLKSEENKMRKRCSIREQISTTPKTTPTARLTLQKKNKNAFAHTVPLAQFIQILNNYTVSVLSSVFINSKISCWFVYDRKIMNNTLILSKCIVISCVTIHSCKLWMLSGVWHLWSVLNI